MYVRKTGTLYNNNKKNFNILGILTKKVNLKNILNPCFQIFMEE